MNPTRIVADGRVRVLSKRRMEIQTDVASEYAEQISQAGTLAKVALRIKMELEIKKRLREQAKTDAPRGGLYLSRHTRKG